MTVLNDIYPLRCVVCVLAGTPHGKHVFLVVYEGESLCHRHLLEKRDRMFDIPPEVTK